MDNTYQALYRVWRPKTFSEMVGQEAIRKTLRSQVKTGRVAHAYLFCGSRGTGKTSAAKIMARAINCLDPRDGDPCGECESCRMILADQSLDVYEMDAASNSRVEEIRELLEKVDYPPQFGKYKVYIIDEVHMLSNSAFNALLKTLEEPPEYMVFILATTEPQKLPATILSRCQRFDFGRIAEADIARRLREAADRAGAEAEDGALMYIAQAAEGGMRDAFSILDMCMGTGDRITEATVRRALGSADRESLMELCGLIADSDAAGALKTVDRVMREGWDVQVFLKDLTALFRQMAAAALCGPDPSVPDGERLAALAARFSVRRLMRVMEILMKAEGDTRWASSARSVLDIAVLSACDKAEGGDLSALLERLGELEKEVETLRREGVAVRPSGADGQAGEGGKTPEKAGDGTPKNEPARRKAPPSENEVWKKAMKILREKNPMVYGLVAACAYGGCVGHEYRVLVLPGGAEAAVLGQSDAANTVGECLWEAGDSEARFEVLTAGSRENAEWDKLLEKNEKTLADLVGRDKLIVVD